MTKGDNHLRAYIGAIERSEDLIRLALLTTNDNAYTRLLRDAVAIAQEWELSEEMREAILLEAWEGLE